MLSETSLAQTVIKLTLNRGPWKDHRWEPHQFVNAGDSAFLSLGVGVQLDEPQYQFKSGIPDGAYSIFVNDTLSLTAFFKHQLEDSVWTFYKYGKLWYTRTFVNGSMINQEAYFGYSPKQTYFNLSPNPDTTLKIPYDVDSETLVVGLTKYAIEHPLILKRFLKDNKLNYNKEDYEAIIHPFRTKSSALRVYKKVPTVLSGSFSDTNCKELQILRAKTDLIYIAGPRIMAIYDHKRDKSRFLFFNNYITVFIDSTNEQEFEKFIVQEKLTITHKVSSENELVYSIKYAESMGAGINDIAHTLEKNKLILKVYTVFKNLEPINSGQARF